MLGIDPGSQRTGYGLIDSRGKQPAYIASGCINVTGQALPSRLREIYVGICTLIDEHGPECLAIEDVFVAQNPRSALILGQARGVAIAAAVSRDLPVAEYAARKVKQSIVGTGAADKAQIQHMVQVLLGLSGRPQADAADALAIALCHVNTATLQ